jgi:hypothetical protein
MGHEFFGVIFASEASYHLGPLELDEVVMQTPCGYPPESCEERIEARVQRIHYVDRARASVLHIDAPM